LIKARSSCIYFIFQTCVYIDHLITSFRFLVLFLHKVKGARNLSEWNLSESLFSTKPESFRMESFRKEFFRIEFPTKHDWPRKFRRRKKTSKNKKYIFFHFSAASIYFASIVHRTIHRSNTGPARPTFVNFSAFQLVTVSLEVPKRTFEAVNFTSRFLSVEHPRKNTRVWLNGIFQKILFKTQLESLRIELFKRNLSENKFIITGIFENGIYKKEYLSENIFNKTGIFQKESFRMESFRIISAKPESFRMESFRKNLSENIFCNTGIFQNGIFQNGIF
jgi:hypothetical protein